MSRLTVIKFGGSLSRNEKALERFLKDIAALAGREPVVLVHGGGPEINSWLGRLGIESKFVDGLRYTDAPTLEVVGMVLSGKVNKSLAAVLNKNGVKAVGIAGVDGGMVRCRHVKKYGFVGAPRNVDVSLLKTLLKGGYLPVLSSLGTGPGGQMLNVNADVLAMAIAKGLKAKRLILLTDVPGVLDAQKQTIPQIRTREVPELLRSGIITGGMIPKIASCCGALRSGIKEVWIVDGAHGLARRKGTVIKK